jgi:hypothetical protein
MNQEHILCLGAVTARQIARSPGPSNRSARDSKGAHADVDDSLANCAALLWWTTNITRT